MKNETSFKGPADAMRYLSAQRPSVKKAWAVESIRLLPDMLRKPDTAAFIHAFMENYLPPFLKLMADGDGVCHRACLDAWVKESYQRGLKQGDAVRVMIALKRVLIKKLVERFRRDAELLRAVCDHVERHLDESRLIIADGFQSLNEGVLRKANIELEHLNKRLRDLGQFKDRLMSNISHEFKTPLSSVRGYVEMMLEGMMGPVSTEQKRGLSISLKSIDRLNVMIEELLFYSRMTEKESPTLRPERFRLKDLVAECLETVKPDAGKKEILLLTGPSPADLLLHADKMKIHQAVTSLLSNAIKFNRRGGRVDISFFKRGRNAVIRIRDTGIGVPEEAARDGAVDHRERPGKSHAYLLRKVRRY